MTFCLLEHINNRNNSNALEVYVISYKDKKQKGSVRPFPGDFSSEKNKVCFSSKKLQKPLRTNYLKLKRMSHLYYCVVIIIPKNKSR